MLTRSLCFLYESMAVPIVVVDASSGRVTYSNSHWQRWASIPHDHHDCLQQHMPEAESHKLLRFLRQAEPGVSDYFLFMVNGLKKSMEVTFIQPLGQQDQTIALRVEPVLDSTETLLQEEYKRLKFSLNNSSIGTWDWNTRTGRVILNDQWADMLGYSLLEIAPDVSSWEGRIHPADKERVLQTLQQHLDGKTDYYDCQHRLRHRDGSWIWVNDRGRVVEWDEHGKPLRVIGTHSDITDLKMTEANLKQERDLFVDGPVMLFKWRNEEGWPVEYVSANVLDRLGYSAGDFLCGLQNYVDLIHPEDLDRVAEEVGGQDQESVFIHLPYRLKTRFGTWISVLDQTTCIRNDSGQITHYHGYLVDVTSRVEAEKELGFLNAIVNMSPDPLYVVAADASLNLIYANHSARNLFAHQHDSIISLHALKARFARENLTALQRMKAGHEQVSFESRCFAREYCEYAEVSVSRVDYDGQQFLVGMIRNIDDRKAIIHQMHQRESQLNAIFQNANVGIMMLKGNRIFEKGNQRLADIFGFASPAEMARISMRRLHLDDAHFQEFGQRYYSQLISQDLFQIEYPLAHQNGSVVWVSLSGRAMDENRPADLNKGVIWIIDDITERLKTKQALSKAEEQSRLLLEFSNEGIFGLDTQGVMTFVNPAAARMLGYSVSEMIGQCNHELIHYADADGQSLIRQDCRMTRAAMNGQPYHVDDEVLWRKDGSHFPVEYWSTPIFRDEELTGAVVTFHNISERKKAEQQIRELAYNDPLTGLPNRRRFLEALEQERQAALMTGSRFALLILDLDHFKDVNDTQGHPTGDKLLQQVALRLKGAIRSQDLVARLGGDEFVIIMSDVDDAAEISPLCERLVRAISQPVLIDLREVITGTSMGVYVFDGSDVTPDAMLSQADVALYQAKERGRGNVAFYEASMAEKVRYEAEIARQLALALSRHELQLHVQPKFSLPCGHLSGYELLMRWTSSSLGNISPAEFIPIAEQRGLIRELGLWVAQEACRHARLFSSLNVPFAPLSINVSRMQLKDPDHVTELLGCLRQSGLGLGVFEIEITETAYSDVKEDVKALLEQARQHGLRIAIDDFGTGYSSLVSLRQLHASSLKIDCQFIRDMNKDPNDRLIVEATINMAHALNMKVIAEGVETRQQLETLRQLKCDMVQGYLGGKPRPLEQFSNASDGLSIGHLLDDDALQ